MPMTTRLRSGARRVNYRKLAGLKARKPRAAKLSKPMARAVKKIVRGQMETKYCTHTIENATGHNSGVTAPDCYRVLPQLNDGDQPFQRIGDKVQPTSLRITGTLWPDRASTDNRPVTARVMVLSLKEAKRFTTAYTAFATQYAFLLKKNDDDSGVEDIPYTGIATDNFLKINPDIFNVHYDKLIPVLTQDNTVGSNGFLSVETAVGSVKPFSCRIKCPKTLIYDNTNVCTNFAPFMVVGYTYNDLQSPDVVSTRVHCTAVSHLSYKDA